MCNIIIDGEEQRIITASFAELAMIVESNHRRMMAVHTEELAITKALVRNSV